MKITINPNELPPEFQGLFKNSDGLVTVELEKTPKEFQQFVKAITGENAKCIEFLSKKVPKDIRVSRSLVESDKTSTAVLKYIAKNGSPEISFLAIKKLEERGEKNK